jgi:hypothetical protein
METCYYYYLTRLASGNEMSEARNTRRVWCFAVVGGREVSDIFAGLNVGISVGGE